MKKGSLAILLAASLSLSGIAVADNVIVTDTASWRAIPITVDSGAHTYTVTGTEPTEGNYYYSYSGYRCFREKRDVVGIDALLFRASVSGGSDIYCYPE